MAEGNAGVADVNPISLSSETSGSATLVEGDNANLNLTNCGVNVGTGHQTIVYNIIGPKGEASQTSEDIKNEELIKICNEHTMDVTAINILNDFEDERLQLPDFEVYPQMQKIDKHGYYKGDYDQTQLTKEVGFLRQDGIAANNIGIDDLVTSIWQKKKSTPPNPVSITAIMASAGSGKSTLTRRIARQALGASPKIRHFEDQPSYGEKMVLYIELKDVVAKDEIKPSKFLFGGLYENDFEEDQAFKWLDEHQSEALLIFDGLDQARWDFEEEEKLRIIKKNEKASSWTVMYNILSRKILPRVNVYIATREFKVSELPASARPKTIVTLNGLTFEDAHRLFVFLLKDNGEELWQKIETMSPRLVNLVSVPVFLILTAVVMGKDPNKPPPATVTELYNRIISALKSVENIRNRKQILSIVNKLKALAFRGMKEGKVVFKETDLNEFGVSAKEVQDLMTKVPGNNLLSRHLMPGDFTFFFCHQSVQEYLAAIFITEMDINEFSRFDQNHLHEERWSVVRLFVAGVVFSKPPNDLYKVSVQTEKQQVLSQSIRSQLEKRKNDGHTCMELYAAIYESNDDNLMKDHSVIKAFNISLSRDEAHVVGSLAARNKSLEYLDLVDCNIDDERLGIIARCLGYRIHVKNVNLCDNNFSATALRSFLGHRRIESLSGNLEWEVVKVTVEGRGSMGFVELKNEEDRIKISGWEVEGHFNIKYSNLSFETVPSVKGAVAAVEFSKKLFDKGFAKLSEELFAKQDDLRKISEYKLGKISKMLLGCTEEDNINWSLIETSVEKYHVDFMDIAVNGEISALDYYRICERRRAIPVSGNIHAMFYVAKKNDLKRIQEACHQKKIEHIRCIFSGGCRASLDEISSLVNSNLKKISLIYRNEEDMLQRSELQKVQMIANDLVTHLEVLKLHRERSAWKQLDMEVSRRGSRRRRQKQQR